MKTMKKMIYVIAIVMMGIGVTGVYAQGPHRGPSAPDRHPQAAPVTHGARHLASPVIRGQIAPTPSHHHPAPPPEFRPAPPPHRPAPPPEPPRSSFLSICLPFLSIGIGK